MLKLFILTLNLAVLVAMGVLYWVTTEIGWQFAAGVGVGSLIYQCAHRVTYGTWFD